jgi:Ca-activated chloride channel family protein
MEAEAPAPAARRHAGTAADAPRAAELFADVAGGPAAAPAPTPEMQSALAPAPEGGTERFAAAPANPLKVTVEEPVSTFSIDVDTASYAFVRRALREGRMPPAGAVRVEEMINYFPYAYRAPAPGGDAPFATHVSVFETPWNADTALVRIGIQGARPAAAAERPPLDLVFLVDSSGSMQDPDKLPLLKRSLAMMLPELRPGDTVAIVTYAGAAGTVLEPTPAAERNRILDALDRLEAGGSTAGAAGLEAAYALAEDAGGAGRIGRVILATDGDFNVGPATPEALKAFIAEKRETGLYLSVLGFGRGNYNDALMQALAQNGNGQAAYIDTLAEARKVLVDQLTGALYPIADDVKIQVEFNPAAVAEYRLIGYETRVLAREDFNDDTVDAGEIGAGHSVTALYEVTPVGSPAVRTTPLRYAAEAPQAGSGPADEIGFLRLRYKAPGAAASRLIEAPVPATLSAPDDEAAFAAAIAGFGQLLTGGRHLNGWDYADAIALAGAARGDDPFGYRAEAVTLMRLAESLSR